MVLSNRKHSENCFPCRPPRFSHQRNLDSSFFLPHPAPTSLCKSFSLQSFASSVSFISAVFQPAVEHLAAINSSRHTGTSVECDGQTWRKKRAGHQRGTQQLFGSVGGSVHPRKGRVGRGGQHCDGQEQSTRRDAFYLLIFLFLHSTLPSPSDQTLCPPPSARRRQAFTHIT